MEAKIISDILNDFMTKRKQEGLTELDYSFAPFTIGIEETNADSLKRMQYTTQDFINEALKIKRIKGIIKTSQSDYIALQGVDSVSFTWSCVMYAPADTDRPLEDYKALVKEYNDKVYRTPDGDKRVMLTFVMPAKFDLVRFGDGKEYSQYVLGGKACVTDTSELSGEMEIEFISQDGSTDITGLLAYSIAYNPSGESTLYSGDQLAKTNVLSYSNAISISIHVLKGSKMAAIIKKAAIIGDVGSYKVNVYDNKQLIGEFSHCKFNSAQIRGSTGSYILADALLLRG